MRLILIPLLLLLSTCSAFTADQVTELPRDPHSFAEPNRVRVTHLDLDLTLDFEARQVRGTAALHLDRRDPTAPLVLDSDELTIDGVSVGGAAREFELAADQEGLGQALTIALQPGDDVVTVAYASAPGAEALQWLDPEQTAGGRYPYLFTQGQSIFTRSWIPLQDTPGVRITYEAKVRCPDGMTVVMSASHLGHRDGAWHFRLDQPIPAYLIALGCGDLTQRAISDRVAVWAEPSMVDAAAYEFADTEKMVQSCEEMYGPYRWERYDMLILPPSFPFGGMENPRLTFLTPTVIAGDRSLVAIIAHELAHSWSGNLVTNATWSDFWLNEGFTVYCEKRIMEVLYGAERAEMEKMLDRDDLLREIDEDLEGWQTVLHIDLDGKHPDEGFSSIPYEKGALFLRRLEEVVGRDRFDAFLTLWFNEHAFESVTTPQFLAFLGEHLPDAVAAVDIEEWVYGEGLPADAPKPQSDAIQIVDAEVSRFLAGTPAAEIETDGWVTQQSVHFINAMPADLGEARMADLDQALKYSDQRNAEIRLAWLKLSIAQGYRANRDVLEEFLLNVGRRRLIEPLYKELAKRPDDRAWAIDVYERAKKGLHAWTRRGCEVALGIAE